MHCSPSLSNQYDDDDDDDDVESFAIYEILLFYFSANI